MIRFLLVFVLFSCLNSTDANRRIHLFHLLYQDSAPALSAFLQELEGLKGEELFQKLHEQTGKDYLVHDYKEAKQFLYDVVDNENGKVRTLYSSLFGLPKGTRYYEDGDENLDGTYGDFVNCEHIWPQSKFSKREPMVSDLHHLYPTFSIPNHIRGSAPFGMVDSATYQTVAGSKFGSGEFEPHDEIKGNVARAMLYFVLRYKGQPILKKTSSQRFWNLRIQQFFLWHQLDPPDGPEILRNDRIEEFQKNRNPLIDAPELVEKIGVEPFLLSDNPKVLEN